MIHLRLRSEYSFRRVFGKIDDVIAAAEGDALALTDAGTWGHVPFYNAARKAGKRPILGTELLVVNDARVRERQRGTSMAILAKNAAGLRELYALVSLANTDECFYYIPRIDTRDINALTGDVVVISGIDPPLDRLTPTPNFYLEVNPSGGVWNTRALKMKGFNVVACADNYLVTPEDRTAYDTMVYERDRISRTAAMHITGEDELRSLIPGVTDEAFLNTERIAAECHVELPQASVVEYPDPVPMRDQCLAGAVRRGLDVINPGVYRDRMEYELSMLLEKGYEDYFYVITDMVRFAKERMLVGPARGSSAGSLVCYLMDITDVDPVRHGLMFERFINITRVDLPDIDIDFPDEQREEVFDYVREKYGADRVARFGTINRYKAKSAIDDVAKSLRIPAWEVKDLKGAIIERSSGDARAQFCVMDAFETIDSAKAILDKHPGLRTAAILEGHARYSGKHAAGLAICQQPVRHYCSVDHNGTVQIDKYAAEQLNILKIDVLGLRTLTVLDECLTQIGKNRDWLINYPLDDTAAFGVLNDERYAGIFQFEGYALQSLCRQMKIKEFLDIVAITTLARPGPLHSGGATEFIERRIGKEPATSLHPLADEYTEETYGVVIYQEQVMAVGRKLGNLTWQDVSELRKAMSKSLGEEFFNQYWEKFEVGAKENGIPHGQARDIWEKLCTFGSWAFNKSHAISYAMISYWCAMLKSRYPLEHAVACLMHEGNEANSIKLLRELVKEGIEFKAFDAERSALGWTVQDGKLIGGIMTLRGVGPKKAALILKAREAGKKCTPGLQAKLDNPVTPYDDIFEAHRRFGDIYIRPKDFKVLSGPVDEIATIADNGEYRFIGRLMEKNLRDLNEYGNVVKRNGRLVARNNLFLNLMLEDDSGSIIATIDRLKYNALGKPIVEFGKVGDWYLWRGNIKNEWRKIFVTHVLALGDDASTLPFSIALLSASS